MPEEKQAIGIIGGADDQCEASGIGPVYIAPHIMAVDDLTLTQKVLWGKILGLTGKKGYCFASNTWLAEQLKLTKGTISAHISTLVTKGHMRRKLIKDSSGRVVERRLFPVFMDMAGVYRENHIGIPRESYRGIPRESQEREELFRKEISTEKEEMSGKPDPALKILEYLNEKAKRSFQASKASLKPIHGRLRDGMPEEKLRLVIDYKVSEWLEDEQMTEYLRPKTLFGPENFQGYLMGAESWEKRGRPSRRLSRSGNLQAAHTRPDGYYDRAGTR